MKYLLSFLGLTVSFALLCLLLTVPSLILGMGISWLLPTVSLGSGLVSGAILVLGSLYFFLQIMGYPEDPEDTKAVEQSYDSEEPTAILIHPRTLRRKSKRPGSRKKR